MKFFSQLCFLTSIIILISCGSGGESSTKLSTEESKAAPSQLEEDEGSADLVLPELIELNPRYTWEELAIASGSDVFPDALNEYAIWDYDLERSPVIFLISDENDFVVLSEPDDELDAGFFQVKQLKLPAESGFFNAASLSYTYYDWLEQDVDSDGIAEYIISAEINGMAGAENGMRPVRYLKSAVFAQQDSKVNYSKALSDQYNKEVGTEESNTKEPMVSFLPKKYYNLSMRVAGLQKSSLMRSLIDDMGIAAKDRNADTAFGKVDEVEDGSFAVYASFVGAKYFVANEEHEFSGLKKVDEDFYPLMIDDYQMTDVYSVSAARVEEGEIRLSLIPLDVSESPREGHDINFNFNGEHWVLVSGDEKWFPAIVRDKLDKIRDD